MEFGNFVICTFIDCAKKKRKKYEKKSKIMRDIFFFTSRLSGRMNMNVKCITCLKCNLELIVHTLLALFGK